MVGRKKKLKVCDKVSQEEGEDRISQLPESLISEILSNLSTEDAVRTRLLCTRWRNHWKLVPGLDLNSYPFPNLKAFVSFVERFFNSHMDSWIRYFLKNVTFLEKLKLHVYYPENAKCDFLQKIVSMPRCSTACEVHCSFLAKKKN